MGIKLRVGVISYANVSVGMGLVSVTSTELEFSRKRCFFIEPLGAIEVSALKYFLPNYVIDSLT